MRWRPAPAATLLLLAVFGVLLQGTVPALDAHGLEFLGPGDWSLLQDAPNALVRLCHLLGLLLLALLVAALVSCSVAFLLVGCAGLLLLLTRHRYRC